ncbi:MAG: hypothetical protein J6A29_00010 [Clostridia bacterium]|nr:hypothetical protein [Clostridia bacterium]
MDKNIDFIREHGKSIREVLRNSKLSGDRLQQRCSLMRKSFKDQYDKDKLDDIERKMIDIMNTTGKNQFSEDDIDIIIRQTLGMEIRDYDKSHLVDLDKGEITVVQKDKIPRDEIKPHPYGDTIIMRIGGLTYKDWRGLEDFSGVSCYAIGRRDARGKVKPYPNEVYSRINFTLMDDDSDYREAVLYYLLDEKNMSKTNCGGYIGSIQTVEEGKSLPDTVKVNGKYSLVFDSTDATAVVKLKESEKEKQEQKQEQDKNNEDEGR